MIREEMLIRKKVMLRAMQKDKAIPHEQIEVVNEELEETNRELDIIYSTPKTLAQHSKDLIDIIGLGTSSNKPSEPVFLIPSKINYKKRDLTKVIRSGVDAIDKRIIGFNPGELSIWSGSNGSGKSSILSQIAIECVDKNFRCAIFSGELEACRVLDWMALQAAGKRHTEGTQYENYYRVPDDIKEKIDKWLDGKFFIYNNDYGTKVENVLRAIKECIDKQGINMVIIDNMMSLDLAGASGEKYEKQTSLVLALCALAKQSNVHIHFVAHPRKSIGFLRKTDISGTADITNAADNVFIVHRVNADFKRTIKQDLGLKDETPLLKFSNVIEIAKNRDLGISDEFIGLYFEKESKRFLNSMNGQKRYCWETDGDDYEKSDNEKLPFDD